MKNINYKEILLNSYLSISDSMSGLKEIAYAKLLFFVLFLENKELNITEIKNSATNFIGSNSIPETSIIDALNLLKSRRLITEKNNKFSLLPDEHQKTIKQFEYSKQISKKIREKHFPKKIDGKKLDDWFNESNETYFSAFAEKLIQLYNKKKSLILGVEKILLPIIEKNNLIDYKNELIQGYKEFLLSSERDEEEKIWNIMQSLLSAKIITADLSPDFLSIDKYNNSEIILDTNILFANNLASNTGIDDTVNSFGKIAKTIGAKLYITKETIDEYQSVIERKKAEMITLWNNYSINILKETNSRDGFLRSLLLLGCENEEDIQRFFSVMKNPPTKIGDSTITVINHSEIYDKTKDQLLFNDIKTAWIERHEGWEKPEGLIIHDLIITKLCQKFAEGKKMFALTLDLSLEALSLKWINDKEEPIWRSLYSLVQVLAINGGGPGFNPNDLAPLVKIFIEQEELGRSDNFDKRDLLMFAELSERIKELSDTKIISLLNKMHLANMSGACDHQTFKDIKLELERSLIKQTHELNEVIGEKEEKINILQGELDKAKTENLKNRKIKKYLWFIIKTMAKFGLSYLLFFLLGNELIKQLELEGVTYEAIQIVLFIFAPIYSIFNDFRITKENLK